MNANVDILIVGFGNMGRALVRGWLDAGIHPDNVKVADSSAAALRQADEWKLAPYDADGEQKFDVLVIAVKPQHVDGALAQFAGALSVDGVVLSIAAGRTIESLRRRIGGERAIVRSMPNTPAAIARGTTVLCANAIVDERQRAVCGKLLAVVGEVFWIEDEAMFDAVTALSGSGPAYVFLLIECLTAAGVRQGLPESLAAELARHTVAGAGAYALAADSPVTVLREQVTSPGGTTAAALGVFLRDSALQRLVDAAIAAAAQRSAELSRE